jgi:hypothetical protein
MFESSLSIWFQSGKEKGKRRELLPKISPKNLDIT